MAPKKKDWFKTNKYPHIGTLLEAKDRKFVSSLVRNPDLISKYSFLPLIHRKLVVRRFRREVAHDGTRSKLRNVSKKKREIYYSSHIDGNIYSYYSALLNKYYERKLVEKNISDCVTAYRKIKLHPSNSYSRNKCNIDFAKNVFDFIKNEQPKTLVAITFDIKSFFDSINHKILKEKWKEVLGNVSELPADHYNVYRNLTKFSFIDELSLFSFYKHKVIIERRSVLDPRLRIHKNKSIKKRKYLKEENAIAFCLKDNINEIRKSGLIRSNKYVDNNGIKVLRDYGIPQGTPISATVANIYLLDFDSAVNIKVLNDCQGIYRRYSDDMIIICEAKHRDKIIQFVKDQILIVNLQIQDAKTQVFEFEFNAVLNRYHCKEYNLNTKKYQGNTKFEYLGFQFDGSRILLKNASLSSYYRKMKRSIRRGIFYAKRSKPQTRGELFKASLYKRFTNAGSHRRRKYVRDKNNRNMFYKSEHYDWGNYLSYVNLADRIMKGHGIKRQLRKHWKVFHEYMKPY
jgi:hypothetical protein